MDIDTRRGQLERIYDDFDRLVIDFKAGAVCNKGCAYCCTHFGTVDITTLEGYVIWNWMESLKKSSRSEIWKKIIRNSRQKEKGETVRCPFLQKNNTCRIYPIRPFSCRQLYSIKACEGTGPTVHRQAVDYSKAAVCRIQQLDDTGYSGHISYVLNLLNDSIFRKTYLSGGFDPSKIMEYGKSHGIGINRMLV